MASGVRKRGKRMVELHVGGACELRCAVCDCRAPPATEPLRALEGGGARLVLRGAPRVEDGVEARFGQVIGAAREQGFAEVVVRTNALSFMQPKDAAALSAMGATGALIPIFSARAAVHDRIAGRPDALAHGLVGMRALAAAGLAVELEVPLLSPKLQDPEAIVSLAHRAAPSLRAVRFFFAPQRVPPPLAPPSLLEAAPLLARALRKCRALGAQATLRANDGLPLCALHDAPDLHDAYRFDPRAKLTLSGGSTYGEACAGCATRAQCPGLTRSYRAAHGELGLAPFARKPQAMYAQRSPGSPVFTAEHHRAASKASMVVLRPTVNCNQDCFFCSANETSNNVWTEPGVMLRAISRAARRGVERISFSGGEPTLSRDLVHYVDAAKRLGVKKIELITNGVLLDDPRRVTALHKAGLTHAFVSLHAHEERLSRVMTQKVGDHARTVQALKNLCDAGVETVVNHVITARNYPYLRHFVDFIHAALGGRVMISFALVTPQYKALEYLSAVPRISDVMPPLRRVLYRALEVGQAVVIGSRQGIPPCFLGEFQGWSDVLKLTAEAASEDAPQKQRGSACEACKYTRVCTGLWKPYVAQHGLSELSPVVGTPLSDEDITAIHRTRMLSRWGTPMAFEELHELVRDRAREMLGRAWYLEEAIEPPPPRTLPMVASSRSRPLRAALVGSGRQARRLARAARNVAGLSIDAIVSPNAPEADLREIGACPTFRSLGDAIAESRPEALIVAAATPAHHALARAALAQGIPTLMEKPLTRTEDEAEELVRLSEELPDALLLPAHNMLFAAGVEALFDAPDLPLVAYARRCTPTSPGVMRTWSRASTYEVLYHALSLVGRAAGGGVPRVIEAEAHGDATPERLRLRLQYTHTEGEIVLDFNATTDETWLARRRRGADASTMSWRRSGPVTSLRIDAREVPVARDGNDVERMLAHFRDVVLGKAEPLVSPRQALDVMRAARAAVDALGAVGAPFERPDAPRHVASPELVAFPRSPGVT